MKTIAIHSFTKLRAKSHLDMSFSLFFFLYFLSVKVDILLLFCLCPNSFPMFGLSSIISSNLPCRDTPYRYLQIFYMPSPYMFSLILCLWCCPLKKVSRTNFGLQTTPTFSPRNSRKKSHVSPQTYWIKCLWENEPICISIFLSRNPDTH